MALISHTLHMKIMGVKSSDFTIGLVSTCDFQFLPRMKTILYGNSYDFHINTF